MTFTLLPGTEVLVRVKNKSATMRRLQKDRRRPLR